MGELCLLGYPNTFSLDKRRKKSEDGRLKVTVPLFDFEMIFLNSKFSLVSSHVLLVDLPTFSFSLTGSSSCDYKFKLT